jgi:hypothetical protein
MMVTTKVMLHSANEPHGPDPGAETPRYAMRHYTVAEIAALWSLSDDAVRHMFEREPGVLMLGNPQPKRGKRSYTTLRIPEDVVERVHRRMSRV